MLLLKHDTTIKELVDMITIQLKFKVEDNGGEYKVEEYGTTRSI